MQKPRSLYVVTERLFMIVPHPIFIKEQAKVMSIPVFHDIKKYAQKN